MHLCFVCRPPVIFLLPLCQLLLFFFSFFLLSGVFLLLSMCMYVCTCATQIAVDGFNQMAAPFCSIFFFFFLPFFEKAPSGICVAPTREMGHKSALFVRNVALKGKKKKIGPHKGGYSNGTHVRPDAALWLTYQPLCCVVRYFFMYYI